MPATPAEKSLRHVLLISAIDGWSIAVFAGFCTLLSLLLASWIGVGIGAIITAAGVIELRGSARLMRGEPAGTGALVGAQLIILVTIVLYAAGNLLLYDEAALIAQIMPMIRDALTQAGVPASDLSDLDLQAILKPVYFGFYLLVIGLTVLFQGGLALYYHSRKAKITDALLARHPAPPELPLL